MPTLSPDLLRAVLDAGEDVPSTGYTPTDEDLARASERVRYAAAIVTAIDGSASLTNGMNATLMIARDRTSPDTVAAARAVLKARSDRSSDGIRLARILLIDAARILAGAVDAVPV